MTLQRLVVDLRSGEVILRVLYRSEDGPSPGTKARTREVTDLARSGLRDALGALEGRAECVGTSGFTTREDILLATTSPSEASEEGGLMAGTITARTFDYFGLLVAASVGALLSAVVTAICIKYEQRLLAWVWAAAFFSCALAAAYFLWRLL